MIANKKVLAGIGAAAVVVSAFGATAANANPTGGGTGPSSRTYSAVGSDTIQDVMNGITNNVSAYGNIASWDAFPAQTITPKTGGATFLAPQGSGDGVKALSATYNPSNDSYVNSLGNTIDLHNVGTDDDGVNEVDIARSSSRPAVGAQVTAGSTNDHISYYPLARDAVSVAVLNQKGTATLPIQITNLTQTELNFLYNSTSTGTLASTSISGGTFTAGSGTTDPTLAVGTTTESLNPMLPQSSSGTRSFFLTAIGVSSIGTWVGGTSTTPENDATQLTNVGDLIPHSAAQWIAQKKGTTTNNTSTATLISIGGVAPTTGSGTSTAPGALFGTLSVEPALGAGSFARDTYLAVDTTNATSALKGEVAGIKSNASAATYFTNYGFGILSYTGTTGQYHTNYTN